MAGAIAYISRDTDGKAWRQVLTAGLGTIDWKEAVELLRSAPERPPLLLELGEDEKVNPLEKLQETFEKLERTE